MNRRLAISLVAVALFAGCSSAPLPTTTPSQAPTRPPATPSPNPFSAGHYDDGMFAFDFPADWNFARPRYPSSVSALKTYLSNEELRDPCVASGGATLCRPPVEELSAGGFLFSWWRWGLNRGAPGPDPIAGELIHVGGRSARIHDATAEGHCLSINSDTSLEVEIPDPTLSGSWTVLRACLREPIADARAAFDTLLGTVTWLSPQPTVTLPFEEAGDVLLDIYDDTGLVTAATVVEPTESDHGPDALADGNNLRVRWFGGICQMPTLGLSEVGSMLLLLLEPDAGPELTLPCADAGFTYIVDLTLSEPINQDDVSLEVW